MNITLTAKSHSNRNGNQTRTHATIEGTSLCVDSTNAKEARRELAHDTYQQLRWANTHVYRMASDGTVFHLHYVNGWAYAIYGRAHADRGFPAMTYFGGSEQDDYRAALAAMERHCSDYAE